MGHRQVLHHRQRIMQHLIEVENEINTLYRLALNMFVRVGHRTRNNLGVGTNPVLGLQNIARFNPVLGLQDITHLRSAFVPSARRIWRHLRRMRDELDALEEEDDDFDEFVDCLLILSNIRRILFPQSEQDGRPRRRPSALATDLSNLSNPNLTDFTNLFPNRMSFAFFHENFYHAIMQNCNALRTALHGT